MSPWHQPFACSAEVALVQKGRTPLVLVRWTHWSGWSGTRGFPRRKSLGAKSRSILGNAGGVGHPSLDAMSLAAEFSNMTPKACFIKGKTDKLRTLL